MRNGRYKNDGIFIPGLWVGFVCDLGSAYRENTGMESNNNVMTVEKGRNRSNKKEKNCLKITFF